MIRRPSSRCAGSPRLRVRWRSSTVPIVLEFELLCEGKNMVRIKFVIVCLSLLVAGSQIQLFKGRIAMGATGVVYPRSGETFSPISGDDWTLYDPNPNNIWNRVYRSLFRRVASDGHGYGYDELDPLLWPSTRYLLSDPAAQQAIDTLDEIISTRAERQVKDPLKRAILQRDLWAIFDWTTRTQHESSAKLKLQIRLVQVMKRLALSPDEIQKLPDSYKEAQRSEEFRVGDDPKVAGKAVLPSKLFDPNGPWIRLEGLGGDPITQSHTAFAVGRSVFSVFIRLPEGREAGLEYLRRLAGFPNPWTYDRQDRRNRRPNPELPQFPAGTQLALVRQMMLIDSSGNLQPTRLIEDMQIRVHRVIPDGAEAIASHSQTRSTLDVYEFRLSRTKLFSGQSGGLRAIGEENKDFPVFQPMNEDVFETSVNHSSSVIEMRSSLDGCATCHALPGVHSMISRGEAPDLIPAFSTAEDISSTKVWKENHYTWGLLQGIWQTSP